MEKRKIVFKLENLPTRTQTLSASEYEEVFGGECKVWGDLCLKNSDCCSSLICYETYLRVCIDK
jgi:hypothetical protein